MNQQPQIEIITKLGPFDVLFGRGSGPNDHEGNVRFRKLVAERKSEYMATNHRVTKAKIAREIVDFVFVENGRFLKKIEADEARMIGLPDGLEAWTGVDEDTIMEKAKQALRQNTNKQKGVSDGFQTLPESMGMRMRTTPEQSTMQQQLSAMPGSNLQPANVGFGVEDLEPIPIPSSSQNKYPSNTVIPGPGQRPRQEPDVDDWQAPNNGSTQQTPLGGFHREPSHVALATPSSQNSMQPPAARGSSGRSGQRTYMEKSMEMGDLMDSFSRTGIRPEERQKEMGNSVETMGTIDPISMSSAADMSIATMSSSVFSIMRPDDGRGGNKLPNEKSTFLSTNEHSFSELEIEDPPSYIQAYKDQGVSDFMSSRILASDASMSINEIGSRRRQPSSIALQEVKEEKFKKAYDSIHDEVNPKSVDSGGIEELGGSSLNLLKGMLMSQDDLGQGDP